MDLQTAFDQGFDVLKAYVDRSLDEYAAQVEELEKRLASLPVPKDGKDADEQSITDAVVERIAPDIKAIRELIEKIPEAPELPDIGNLIAEAVKELPAPKDGEPGKDADPEATKAMIAEQVSEAVKELPKPKDGEPGKNGADITGGTVNRDGHLIVTLSNGETKDFGLVVGKDGAPGKDGKDGRDGFSLSDFDADLHEDGRTVLLSFTQGETKHTIELGFPAMIYRGVYKDGGEYQKGDCVTWGGSIWHSEKDDNPDKPGDASESWKLAVKKGRDGKKVD